ncbi:putative baseplate assembly protein [Paraburkholderia guartelaensis]|uniref:putative baseplate assembly protein n=1 Tax=Paraburkholderia guartelaensis TaxID=2546446 RepID=UPI002AB750DF|nr:putative baseplate assembly protein [Paraburkholderia guartelaensis]
MMIATSGDCELDRRRQAVRQSSLYGIDFVEVSASQTTLEVYFLGKAPQGIEAANVSMTGGSAVSVTGIRVNRQPDPTLDDWMEVDVNRPGDWSQYTLSLLGAPSASAPGAAPVPMPGFDPLFASATFSFKASCPSDLDCCAPHVCAPPAAAQPDINYLAKDYESFRRLMFDRLALTMPAWQETHVPDIGVMLVELLAYVGDHLSYYQDAVATEAYLNTCRQRISLRRHARLVDYAMHEGCNARAWLTIAVTRDQSLDLGQVGFCTQFAGAPQRRVLRESDLANLPPGSYEWFEALWPPRSQVVELRAAHTQIAFYTWGDCACCLPTGTTRATLLDSWTSGADGARTRALDLHEGDVLIFEEVIGPLTGNPADADPTHRQAVRLTSVTQSADPLYDAEKGGTPVVEIAWCPGDALTFPLCLSAVMPAPDCTCRDGISVARGNVVLVDSGASSCETIGPVPTQTSTTKCASDCEPATVQLSPPPRFRPCLAGTPLTFAQPVTHACCASDLVTQDPRSAVPALTLKTGGTTWTALPDLLESGPDDTCLVVEIDDNGVAHLRFGDDTNGRRPPAGTTFDACYRLGDGPDGNVGADTITCVVYTSAGGSEGDFAPRNPLPATGGTAPEAAADVRMFAPNAFRSQIERAIVADDYATLASDNARRLAQRPRGSCGEPFQKLQGAKASLRWTGCVYEVCVAVDPLGSETAGVALLDEIDAYLARYRRIGYDLRVEAPDYLPIDLGVSVCVMANYQRAHVRSALLAALGTGVLPGGALGLFNPDNQSFGQGVYVSRIVAAAQAIPGVIETQVTRLAPYVAGRPAPGATPDDVPAGGVLALTPFQIARLDNDPGMPANGRLTLLLRGGR